MEQIDIEENQMNQMQQEEIQALRIQNDMIQIKNDREVEKIRKKIKTMKVQNWLVSVNSPLHKDFTQNNPNPLRIQQKKRAKSRAGAGYY